MSELMGIPTADGGDESSLSLDLGTRNDGPPDRPAPWVEWLARRLLTALAPGLEPSASREDQPRDRWAPFSRVALRRSRDEGHLEGWFFPAQPREDEAPRGAVLMCHPWLPFAQSYFLRRQRIPALRAAGFHVMTFDFGGFGASGPRPKGYFDVDVNDALDELARMAPGLPLHLWGVSFGGYWAHLALSRRDQTIGGVFFEHVADHLIEWSKRTTPWGMPCFLFYQHVLGSAYRFLDLERHAGHLRARAVTYVGGDEDPGIPLDALHRLAHRAHARRCVVRGAGHLDAIRQDGRRVIELAIDTFRKAEES